MKNLIRFRDNRTEDPEDDYILMEDSWDFVVIPFHMEWEAPCEGEGCRYCAGLVVEGWHCYPYDPRWPNTGAPKENSATMAVFSEE